MFLEFYGLNEQPFGVTPDPRFLYMGAAHQEALASLVYGVETGRGFMALIAAPGLGKTTLVHRLMERLRDSALTAFLFQTHTNSQEFLRNLLRDLDVEPAGQTLSDLQEQLHQVLIRGAQSGKRVVLVIDEAQNLDDSLLETVRMLSNFETPEAKLLQVLLVGQPSLADKLVRPHLAQLRQRISIITHFPPFQGRDIEKYILQRLRVAGYKGGRLFSPAAMNLIAVYSGGIPRVINNLCFSALSLAFAKGQKVIDESTLREAISDLNLESLGERQGPARPPAERQAPVQRAVNGKREESRKDVFPAVDIGSRHLEAGVGLLDGVEFSDHSPRPMGEFANGVLFSSRRPADASSQRKLHAGILVLLALAAASICIWRAAWLKPSLSFLEQAAWSAADKLQGKQSLAVNNPPGGGEPPQSPSTLPPQGSLNVGGGTYRPDSDKSGPQQAPPYMDAGAPIISGASAQPDAASGAGSMPAVAEKTSPAISHLHQVKGRGATQPDKGGSLDDMGVPGARGELIVQSKVRGATIRLNGRSEPDWATPHLFSLAAGTYILSVSKGGYSTWTSRVHVDEKHETWVTADFDYQQGDGVLIVDTDPTGMQVFIDGKPYGVSHLETLLHPGWHVCAIIPGQGLKPVMRQFHLDPGEALTRRIRVVSAAAPGAPAVQPRSSASGANVLTSTPRGESLE